MLFYQFALLCFGARLVKAVVGDSESTRFNPRDFTKRSVTCQAVKRDAGHSIVDINLSYVDINPDANTTLLMVHGWPSLWSSWAYQIQEFKGDYHLIVPDLRGFGESTHPDDNKASGTLYDIVGDLACIMEHAKVKSAVCVGHDWGAAVCYEAARSRPDLFEAMIGAVVPYIPSADEFIAVKDLVTAIPKLTYQLYFDEKTGEAVEELDTDIRRTIRATLRTKGSPPPEQYLTSTDSFLDAWSHLEEIPAVPFLSPEEEDYFVEQYESQGFKNTLQFYTDENRRASWKFAHEQGNHTIPQPVLSILPTDDPVADWALAARILHSETFLPNLTTKMLPGAHWVHLEYPELFNDVMREWLEKLPRTRPEFEEVEATSHVGDEL